MNDRSEFSEASLSTQPSLAQRSDAAERVANADSSDVVRSEETEHSQDVASAPVVAEAHTHLGNHSVQQVLTGADQGAYGQMVADHLTAEVGGFTSEGLVGSNQEMNARLRDAIQDEGLDMVSADRAIAASSGRALPDEHLERFEEAFDHDFGHVRVHTGGSAARAAADIHAHAFAIGSEIYFGAGEYAPGTDAGDRLLAHELTHVVQHDEGRLPSGGGVSSPTDPHEVEAYANESVILKRLDAPVSGDAEPGTAADVEAEGPAEGVAADDSLAGTEVDRAGASESQDTMGMHAVPGAVGQALDSRLGEASESAGSDHLFSARLKVADGRNTRGANPEDDATLFDGEQDLAQPFHAEAMGGVALEMGRLTDVDPERLKLTRRLLNRLEQTLGLSGVRVRVDAESTRRVRSLGTRGLMEDGEVLLDADQYDPSTKDGEALLAHEVMHVAQARLVAQPLDTPLAMEPLTAGQRVESEAEMFAAAFALGGGGDMSAQVAMPDGHVAMENPAAGIRDTTTANTTALDEKKAKTTEKAATKAPTTKAEAKEVKEDRAKKVSDYKDGLEEIADKLEDTDAFEALADALKGEDSAKRDAAMGRVRDQESYKQMKEQWQGAREGKEDATAMKDAFTDKFKDRSYGKWETAWNYVLRKAKAEAVEDELAAQAKKDLAEAEGKEAPEEKKGEDNGDVETGEGTGSGASADGAEGAGAQDSGEVPKEFPATPAADLALTNRKEIQPLIGQEVGDYTRRTKAFEESANGGLLGRGGAIADELGSRFVGGVAKGFIGGLQDSLMDTATDFGDKLLGKATKGKMPPGVSFIGSAVSLYESGLLKGDFSGYIDSQGQALEKIGESADKGMENWEKAQAASGLDAFGLYCASIADWLQVAIESLEWVSNLLGTLSAICFVVGGILIIVGLALAWLGVGAGMISAGGWLIRAGNTLNKVKDVLDAVVGILKPIQFVIRLIAAFTVPADAFAEQVEALGMSAEAFGEEKGKRVSSSMVEEMKKKAKDEEPAEQAKEEAEDAKKGEEGAGEADAALKDAEAEVSAAAEELEKGKKQLEEEEAAHIEATKEKEQEGGEEGEATTQAASGGEAEGEMPTASATERVGKVVKDEFSVKALNPVTHIKGKWDDLKKATGELTADVRTYRDEFHLGTYELVGNALETTEAEGRVGKALVPDLEKAQAELQKKRERLTGDLTEANEALTKARETALAGDLSDADRVAAVLEVEKAQKSVDDAEAAIKGLERTEQQLAERAHYEYYRENPIEVTDEEIEQAMYWQTPLPASTPKGPHPDAFSAPEQPVKTKEAKAILGLLGSGVTALEGSLLAKKTDAPTGTKADQAAADAKTVLKSNKAQIEAKEPQKGPFASTIEWYGSAGKKASDAITHTLSGPRIGEVIEPKPPIKMEEMNEVYEGAQEESVAFAQDHARAYNAYQSELVARGEVAVDEAAVGVGEQNQMQVEAQQGPLAQGQQDAQARDQQVANANMETKPADGGIMGLIAGLISRLASNSSHVEGDAGNSEGAAEEGVGAQDKVDSDAKQNEEEMKSGSQDTVAVVEQQEAARAATGDQVDSDKAELEAKRDENKAGAEEIRATKDEYLASRDEHLAKLEGKSTEYNLMVDEMAGWAADYKKKRLSW